MTARAKASDGSATNAETASPAHSAPPMTGLAGSKYDFVKVRVWLGPNRAHWYTLSRFLISRTLTASRIPQDKVRPRVPVMCPLYKELAHNIT